MEALAVIVLWGALSWSLYSLLPKVFDGYRHAQEGTDADQIDADARDKLVLHSIGLALVVLVGIGWVFDVVTTKLVVVLVVWSVLSYALYRVLPKVFSEYDYFSVGYVDTDVQVKTFMHSVALAAALMLGFAWLVGYFE